MIKPGQIYYDVKFLRYYLIIEKFLCTITIYLIKENIFYSWSVPTLEKWIKNEEIKRII